VAQPGDRICLTCGEPNDAARKFCRRCGSNLVAAQVVQPPKLPWWKRLFTRSPKAARTYAAGERTRSMQAGSIGGGAKKGLAGLMKARTLVVTILGALAAIGVIGYVGVPGFQSTVNGLIGGGPDRLIENLRKLIVPTISIERPVRDSVVSADQVDDAVAARVFDTFTNTHWAAAGEKPELQLAFARPIDLDSVIVHSGADAGFVDLRRPQVLEFVFEDGTSKVISLVDEHKPQTFELEHDDVQTLIVRITSTYGPDDQPVALSELEFFKSE
jgi:hypothetical protein